MIGFDSAVVRGEIMPKTRKFLLCAQYKFNNSTKKFEYKLCLPECKYVGHDYYDLYRHMGVHHKEYDISWPICYCRAVVNGRRCTFITNNVAEAENHIAIAHQCLKRCRFCGSSLELNKCSGLKEKEGQT